MVLERFLRNNCGHWPCSIQKSLGLSRPAGGCTLTTSLLEGASIAAANRGIFTYWLAILPEMHNRHRARPFSGSANRREE